MTPPTSEGWPLKGLEELLVTRVVVIQDPAQNPPTVEYRNVLLQFVEGGFTRIVFPNRIIKLPETRIWEYEYAIGSSRWNDTIRWMRESVEEIRDKERKEKQRGKEHHDQSVG